LANQNKNFFVQIGQISIFNLQSQFSMRSLIRALGLRFVHVECPNMLLLAPIRSKL